jgi:diguanylate cyclase (GGDEF)-like protein
MDQIRIRGARTHKLKNISLDLPRNRLTVITGLSGSGKSSLAFDTLYAEGQRRYVESLSAYARQFLGQMQKPDVDYIEGLSPAIAIEQRTAGSNPRSIVAIPVKSHGRPVAALVGLDVTLAPRVPEPPPDETRLAPLAALVDAVGSPLDAAMRLKRANALSAIDDLTGLYNSRFLHGALRRELKRAVRTGRPLSLLFVDLDGFKGINDRYGHLCGSRALVEAAGRIQSGARETDIVARFGGDEFALLLRDCDTRGAEQVARSLQERLAGCNFYAALFGSVQR